MKLPVVLRDEARDEFDEAFDWYERQRAGLGKTLIHRIQEVLERISAHPATHAVVLADVRKAVVKQFPYCVFYRATESRVEVLAVFHCSRDPEIWQSRTRC